MALCFSPVRGSTRVRVMRYLKYDRERHSPVNELVGTITDGTFRAVPARASLITPEEWKEIETNVERLRQERDKSSQEQDFYDLPKVLKGAIATLKTYETVKGGCSEEWAKSVWEGIDRLGRLLRKAGFAQRRLLRPTKGDGNDE